MELLLPVSFGVTSFHHLIWGLIFDVCQQPGFLNPQMVAQRNREMMTISQMRRQRMMMLMQQQGQGAAGGFNPPPNVTAPGGMDGPVGASAMNQTGQQGFNYGANYGK